MSVRVYVVIGVSMFTLLLILITLSTLHKRFDYVELPNGAKLVQRGLTGNEIVLLSAGGIEVVKPGIMEIIWNDTHVAGRLIKPDIMRAQNHVAYFIYKVGERQAVTYEQTSLFDYGDYRLRLKQAGLAETTEITLGKSISNERTFWDLIAIPRYRRAWYQ